MRRVEVSKGGRGWRPARGAARAQIRDRERDRPDPHRSIGTARACAHRRDRASRGAFLFSRASLGNENRINGHVFFSRESDDRRTGVSGPTPNKSRMLYCIPLETNIRRSARALPLLGRVAAHGWWAGLWAAEAGPRDKHMVPQRRCAASASDMRRGRQHMRAHPFVSATSFWGVTRLP